MPPITIAGVSNLIASNDFTTELRASALQGLAYREVAKKRIVRLDWRSWDLNAADPAKYPAGNEPENYIDGRKHDPALADAMGEMWEVVVDRTVEDPMDADLVRSAATAFSHLLASEQAVEWFALHAPDSLAFESQQGEGRRRLFRRRS